MMLKTYIAADLNLFDKKAAKRFGMYVETYNRKVIEKINSKLDEKDFLVLIGNVSSGSVIGTLHYLSKIKAKLQIVNNDEQQWFNSLSSEEKTETFDFVMDKIGCFVPVTINGKQTSIVIPCMKDFIDKVFTEDVYVAAPSSFIDTGELFKDRILNISISEWNCEPIEMGTQLPQIIDDLELFSTMETKEESFNI